MREYINIYQLDDIGNKIKIDDYLIISQNALSYKFRLGEFRDFIIDDIDVDAPIYNANRLLGYNIEFTEPLTDNQLLTFDESMDAWTNKELDIDLLFQTPNFEPTKFLRLDAQGKVTTSDVLVSDLVVDTPDKADTFLGVANNGSDVIYVDIYGYINDTIDDRSGTFIPLLEAEIDRATAEEQRIQDELEAEIDRATAEEQRIEAKFDNLIAVEVSNLEGVVEGVRTDLTDLINAEIDRATAEEQRIESLVIVERDRAIDEEQRIENKFDNLINTNIVNITDSIDDLDSRLTSDLQNEIDRATAEENRLDGLIGDVDDRLDVEINRATTEERRLEQMIINAIDDISGIGGVDATPDTLVLRDGNGTSKFSEPTHPEHPIRLGDTSSDPIPGKVVIRDSDGKIVEVGDGLKGVGTENDPIDIRLSTRSGNLLQLGDDGLYYGQKAPPDLSILYVAAAGNDSNPGTRNQPLKTLAEAISRLPPNMSSTIRVRAGETFYMPSATVSGATRTIEPYDDPYIDGDKVPTLTPTLWYYNKNAVAEINRPNIVFDWVFDSGTNTARLKKLLFDNGGIWQFNTCNIVRAEEIPATNYATFTIFGSPAFYNGVFLAEGCEFIDRATDAIANPSISSMIQIRRDSGSVTINLIGTRASIVNSSRPLIYLYGMPITITADGTNQPTPVPVPGMTAFQDNFVNNASNMIKGVNKVNGVPVNVLTNLTNI